VSPAALSERLLGRARVYPVGAVIRWDWLAEAIAPCLEGREVRVLDAGCGDGAYLFRLARRYPGATFAGVDLSEEPIRCAQARLAAHPQPNLTFALADLTHDQGDRLYDLIYSIDVFEHIPDDRAALAALARALQPGGRTLLHTPLSPQRHWLRRFDLDRCQDEDHVRAGYSVAELEAKARAAGLAPSGVHYTHGRWGTLAWELWMLAKDAGWSRAAAWPAIRLLVSLEFAGEHEWGNCLLFEATKP